MADENPVEVPQEPLDYIAILKKSLLTGHAADHYPFGIPCVRLVDILTMKEKKLLNSKPQVDRNKVVQEINNLHKDFIRLTETVGNLVQDSRHEEVLQCLKNTMDNARPSWQMVFTCLSAVVKGPQSTPASAAAGYLLLPQLLKNSTMLFFFLQNLKLAKPNPKKAGFGRGLKTAIRRWYYQLTPEQLLLELWHRPHAYNWSHKDVMKLVHIQPEALPIGLQVIVFWFFNDLAQTKSKYAPVQDAAVYVNYIDNLVNKEHEGSLQFLRVEMLQKLEPTSQCRLVRTQDKLLRDSKGYPHLLEKLDSPSVILASSDPSFIMTMTESSADADAYTSPPEPSEIQWSASHALVEQLQRSDLPKQVPPVNLIISANNMTRRIKNSLSPRGKQVWRGGVPLLVSPLRKQELYKTPIMAHLLEPLNLYSSLVHKAALEHSVASLFPDLYFVCEPNMQLRKFIDTMPGFNVHKQLRTSQAMMLSLVTFCNMAGRDEQQRAFRCTDADELLTPLTLQATDFDNMVQELERLCYTSLTRDRALLTEVMAICKTKKAKQLIFFCPVLVAGYKTQVKEYLQNTPKNEGLNKIVVVGIDAPMGEPSQQELSESRLLCLSGFHENSIAIITAFLKDQY